MKNRRFLTALVSAIFLLALGFLGGKAYAAASCFTDTTGHWAETYICWLKDNGISTGFPDGSYQPESPIKRSEMAVMLKRQAEVPPTSGVIAISEGFGNWIAWHSSSPLVFYHGPVYTGIQPQSASTDHIRLHTSVPTVLYGNSLEFMGVEFCYFAQITAIMNRFEINVPSHTTSGVGAPGISYYDETDRTDQACRYYTLTTPVTLTVNNSINLSVTVTWTNPSHNFNVGRTTFFFQPTGTKAVLPAEMENATVLSEGITPPDVQSANP